jgi:general secretion pathway protein G
LRPHDQQRAFTLLEPLVVVVIIGLPVGYVAPRCFGQVGKSEVTTAKAQGWPLPAWFRR